MMCDADRMTVEDAYLKALASVSSFSFLPGQRLALTYLDRGTPKSLVFVGKQAPGK